jgi:hypothetical protein
MEPMLEKKVSYAAGIVAEAAPVLMAAVNGTEPEAEEVALQAALLGSA